MSKRTLAATHSRAYSTIVVKKADSKTRTIKGMATTPTPDRLGDVVEPKGAIFKLPIPLLWQHDSKKPVGHVTRAKVTKDGIEFEATIESHDEPGTLKDRLDEAWHSVVKGLVRGVSIGFSTKEPPELMRNGGLRFLSWEWFELSLVTIPANADASIDQIKRIKSISREQLRAAPGRQRAASKSHTTPAVAGKPKHPKTESTPMSKHTDKLKALADEIDAKRLRMKALLEGAESEDDRDLDDDEQKEFDALEDEVAELDRKAKRLKSAYGSDDAPSRGVVRQVKADDVTTAARASALRGSVEPQPKTHAEKGIGFARMVMCFAAGNGSWSEAVQIAKQRYSADDPVNKALPVIYKAQVAGGTSFDPTWAGPLVEPQNLVSEFVEYLRPQTIIGRFGTNGIPALRQVPFNIKVPVQISGGAADWVKEGKAKPLTKFDFNSITMRFNKVAAIAVISEELVRHSAPSAELLVRNSLAEAVVEKLDTDIVNPSVSEVAETNPGSFTNGAQTYTSLGITADDVRADVKRLVTFFIANNIPTNSLVFVMRQAQALALSLMRNTLGAKEFPDMTMNGGLLEGIPVLASQYVPTGVVAAVCASEIYLADDGGVRVDMSREASLEMATDPSSASSDGASPPAPAETTLVSMFQTNSVAIRAERIITWKRRRTAAVAYQTATGWGNADTSPPQAAV